LYSLQLAGHMAFDSGAAYSGNVVSHKNEVTPRQAGLVTQN